MPRRFFNDVVVELQRASAVQIAVPAEERIDRLREQDRFLPFRRAVDPEKKPVDGSTQTTIFGPGGRMNSS
jgi:hypothetical protein